MSARDSFVPSPFAGLGKGLDRAVARGINAITGRAIGPYQSAIIRIGFSLTWLLFLLREFPHRAELYGPDAPWSWDLAKRLVAGNHAFTVLLWNDGRAWFECVYAFAIVASAMLLLGWRTRTASVFFMIGVLSLQNRSVFEGDGGDNVIHLMAIYLVFTRCGQVWSLDRRRAARGEAAEAGAGPTAVSASDAEPGADPVGVALWAVFGFALVAATLFGKLSTGWAVLFWLFWLVQALWWAVRRVAPGEPRTVLDIIANVIHNGAMLVIVAEVCLIYSTAGWYKIQGSRWQDGTALYYPLHLDDFTPWPALSHALAGNELMVMLITYGTVIVQVAFPFTLFNRRVKNVLLVAMMLEHASIAVVLGLPFFSLAMIAADAVFLPTAFLVWAGDRLVRRLRPGAARPRPVVHGQRTAPDDASAGPGEPAVGPPPPSAVT
ncbi:HTTM domain-containing protein [Streptomyces sp. NPDC088910]|uniref:HTTM domain-containing protein n=1 Tax=Streptomyces sp. NPDC088910 TaxID=3365911 RepID=UPI0037F758FB